MAAHMWMFWEANGRMDSPLRYCSAECVRLMSPDHIMRALAVDGEGIRHIPLHLQTEAMALCSLQQTPRAYGYFNNRLNADPHIAFLAIRGDYVNYYISSKKTKEDPEILLMALLAAGPQMEQFMTYVQPDVLERTLALAEKCQQQRLTCRSTFAAGALHPGILKQLRFHGVHFLKQFNDSILGYAGLLSGDLQLTIRTIAKNLSIG